MKRLEPYMFHINIITFIISAVMTIYLVTKLNKIVTHLENKYEPIIEKVEKYNKLYFDDDSIKEKKVPTKGV